VPVWVKFVIVMYWPVLTLTVSAALVMIRVWNCVSVAKTATTKTESDNNGAISFFINSIQALANCETLISPFSIRNETAGVARIDGYCRRASNNEIVDDL
jgi:hypothetical protein